MNSLLCKHFCLTTLFILLTFSTPATAQITDETKPASELTEEQTRDKASADLRESVHENLDTLPENVESAEKLAKEQEEPETEDKESTTPGTGALFNEQIPDEQSTEDKSLFDLIRSIPEYLQSVPERVPFIQERGLIFFGRAELDYANYSTGLTKNDSGFRVRSLRAGLAKAFKYNFSVKAEVDLTDGDSNFSDLYVRYHNQRLGMFTIGNQHVAQTLVNQTSRISRTFMEEPLPAEAFGLGRRLALGWDMHRTKGGVHVTLFGSDLNGSIGDSGYAGRVYFNPTRSRFSLFHIGVSLVSEKMSRKTRFFSHPESRVTSIRLVDTGLFDDINRQEIYGLELAGAKGSFMFRSEFFSATWQRKNGKNPEFNGFYTQASWVLTGESFKYVQGKFVRIRPQNPRGAWEAAVRFSRVDLNDLKISGGLERNLTIGLNWYAPGNQFRLMANLIFVNTDEHAGDEDPTIFQLRAQLHW